MRVAALPGRCDEQLRHCLLQPLMIVADDELHARQPTLLEPLEEFLPTAGALPVGQLHGEDLAPAFPVDADGDQDGLAADHAVDAHLLVPGVQDQVRAGFFQRPVGEPGQRAIEPLC
jgi:hypothetical protein